MSRAVVLMPPGAADWEFGPLLPVLKYFFQMEVSVASPDGRAVQTIGGLRIEADRPFDTADLAESDLVVLIGSDAWIAVDDAHLNHRLKSRAEAGRPLAAVCAGTLPLARAGVLDARPHTSNALGFLTENAPGYGGREHYRDLPHAVSDGVVVTAPGTAPASFAVACAAAVHPQRAAEAMAYWTFARAEFAALGDDLGPVFGR